MVETILDLEVYEDPEGYYKTYTLAAPPYEWDAQQGDALIFQPPIIFNHYEDVEVQMNKDKNCEMWVMPIPQFPLEEWSKALNNTGTGNFVKHWHLGNLFRMQLGLRAKTTGLVTISFLQIRIEK